MFGDMVYFTDLLWLTVLSVILFSLFQLFLNFETHPGGMLWVVCKVLALWHSVYLSQINTLYRITLVGAGKAFSAEVVRPLFSWARCLVALDWVSRSFPDCSRVALKQGHTPHCPVLTFSAVPSLTPRCLCCNMWFQSVSSYRNAVYTELI